MSIPNFRERVLPKSRMWRPKSIVVCRWVEDWEFKVWQWLNSWLPWWPFQYLSAANLLKSFHSPLPLHKVPYQLRAWLSVPLSGSTGTCFSLSLSLSDTHRHALKTNQTNQSLPIAPFPLPLPWQEKTAVAPFKTPIALQVLQFRLSLLFVSQD